MARERSVRQRFRRGIETNSGNEAFVSYKNEAPNCQEEFARLKAWL